MKSQHSVGWFPFWLLPVSTGVICSFGILATYFLALHEGHIKPFPYTDITHAAIQYPEYIIFRSCLITGSILIGVVFAIVAWWIQIQAERASIQATGLPFITHGGWVAAFLLCLSTASISDGGDMNWTVHIIGATGFFAVVLFVLGVISKNYRLLHAANQDFVSKTSYTIKMVLNLIMIGLGLTYLASKFVKNLPDWIGDAVEWSLTLVVIVYVGTFGLDLYNVQGQFEEVAEAEEEQENKTTIPEDVVEGEAISTKGITQVASSPMMMYHHPQQYYTVVANQQY